MGLEKLSVVAYEKDDFNKRVFEESEGKDFFTMINPTQIKTGYTIELGPDEGSASNLEGTKDSNVSPVIKGLGPETLSFDVLLDGTGVLTEGRPVSVSHEIELLKANCYYPYAPGNYPRCIITYGGIEFKGVLKSLGVNYTLFKRTGEPLRAEISCEFEKAISSELAQVEGKKQQKTTKQYPILHTVQKYDNLPVLCNKYYGSMSNYMDVAADNGLKSIQDLEIGQTIKFNDPSKF